MTEPPDALAKAEGNAPQEPVGVDHALFLRVMERAAKRKLRRGLLGLWPLFGLFLVGSALVLLSSHLARAGVPVGLMRLLILVLCTGLIGVLIRGTGR